MAQDRFGQVGIVRRAILLVPRDQPDGRAPPPQERPLPVELRLIHPRRIGEDVFRERGEHRRRERRHGGSLKPLLVLGIEPFEQRIHRTAG